MMFNQTFATADIPRVIVLLFVEILLSADNAIVLGLFIRRLPLNERKTALFIGSLSGLAFRLLALLFISFLLKYTWLQLLGALYLFYISLRHLWKNQKSSKLLDPLGKSRCNFWKTVALIELVDFTFAFDSIIAGVAFIHSIPIPAGQIHPKMWIVYLGAILGLLTIRFAATLFSNLIERFPRLERTAYILVGWIGFKLAIGAVSQIFNWPDTVMNIFEPIFWVALLALFVFGLQKKKL